MRIKEYGLKFFILIDEKKLVTHRFRGRLHPGNCVSACVKLQNTSRISADEAVKVLSGGHKNGFSRFVFTERQVIKLFSSLENI